MLWEAHSLILIPGMFVFWTLQTVCFALYSERGDLAAAHTFIAMICESLSLPEVFVEIDGCVHTQSCSTVSVSNLYP